MQSRAVEPERQGVVYVALHRLDVRHRVDSVGVIPLIENEFLKNAPAVQQKSVAVVFYASESEIGGNPIVFVFDRNVVKLAFADFPQVFFTKFDVKTRLIRELAARFPDLSFIVEHCYAIIALPRSFELDPDFRGFGIGIKPKILYVICGHKFEPHGLPDPRNSRVKATERVLFVRLFAERVRSFFVVADFQQQFVFAARQQFGYIERERRISARMPARVFSVDVQNRMIIDRAEIYKHPPGFAIYGKAVFVIADVNEILMPYARKFTFRTKRHADFPPRHLVETEQPAVV